MFDISILLFLLGNVEERTDSAVSEHEHGGKLEDVSEVRRDAHYIKGNGYLVCRPAYEIVTTKVLMTFFSALFSFCLYIAL